MENEIIATYKINGQAQSYGIVGNEDPESIRNFVTICGKRLGASSVVVRIGNKMILQLSLNDATRTMH